jgi:HEXXH motif-containing protein
MAAIATQYNALQGLDLPDLTVPLADTRTLRRVLNAYWQRILHDVARVPLAAVATHNRALYDRTCQALRAAQARDPRKALHVVRQPTVSVLVECIQHQLAGVPDSALLNAWLRELCALVLLELATLGELPSAGVTVGRDPDGHFPILRSPTANLALRAYEVVTAITFRPHALTLHEGMQTVNVALRPDGKWLDQKQELALPAEMDHPYLAIVPGVFLALTDNNPLANVEAHPDKNGNRLDLGGRDVTEWLNSLRKAIADIDAHMPLIGEELRLCMRLFVPVGYDDHKHLSASFQEAVGLIYLTLHPQQMTMTEAVVHEYQHNKINAAFRLDPLLHNAWSPLYPSPVRPDPRPLHGVVLAVHAFQPIARLYEEMARAARPEATNAFWNERFRKIIHINRAGADTVLTNAQPTTAGAGLFAEMRALDAHFRAYETERWPDREDGADLTELAEQHD